MYSSLLGLIFCLLLFVAIATGWGLNMYKFVKCDFEAPYKAEILRGIGIIPPIGAIMGWIHIED